MPHVKYFWDEMEDNVVEEYDGDTGSTIASYTTEPTKYGSVLSQDRGGEKMYFQFDGLGDTRTVTGHNGDAVESAAYSAFGEIVKASGSIANPFGYKGALGFFEDSITECVDVRARAYNTRRARWSSPDPLGDYIAVSGHYSYVGNSPLNAVDPSGLLTATAAQVYCPGCGNAAMRWRVTSQNFAKEGLVVQKICFEINIVTCEYTSSCCKGTRRHYCKTCYYEELIHFTDELVTTDLWRVPRVTSNGCGQRGVATVHSQLRGFPYRKAGYPMQEWTEGDGTVSCGEFSIRALNFSDQQPKWWAQHTTEVTSRMDVRWKCCEQDDRKSSLQYDSSSGELGQSSCDDQIDPRWE